MIDLVRIHNHLKETNNKMRLSTGLLVLILFGVFLVGHSVLGERMVHDAHAAEGYEYKGAAEPTDEELVDQMKDWFGKNHFQFAP